MKCIRKWRAQNIVLDGVEKPSEQRLSEARGQHTEAIVAQHVHQLFQCLPMLSGFWLRPDLKVAELSVFTSPATPPVVICTRR